jgi:anti-sigma factor RsiW
MDKFLLSNLEGYLSHQLGEATRREFESRLERNPKAREEVDRMVGISGMFGSFDISSDECLGPPPGFCSKVLRRIEAESKPEFWDFLLQPLVIRRVAMASCAWLLMLFSASAYDSIGQPSTEHFAQAILAEPPESADYCNVRLGCDIDMNRSSMLAAVMVSGNFGQ